MMYVHILRLSYAWAQKNTIYKLLYGSAWYCLLLPYPSHNPKHLAPSFLQDAVKGPSMRTTVGSKGRKTLH